MSTVDGVAQEQVECDGRSQQIWVRPKDICRMQDSHHSQEF
jgi:hypothetical protein